MNIKIIIYLFIVLGVVACRKDKPVPSLEINPECYSFTGNIPATTYYGEERFQYKAPFFNPNNPDEIVYHFRDYELNIYQLIKYNLQTSQKSILTESGKIAMQPKWSRKGWIAYTHYFGYVDHIYVIKDNGDSLRQFTYNTANMYPAWSSSGNELYWVHVPVLSGPRYFFRKSINNEVIDTILRPDDLHAGTSFYNDISFNNQLVSLTRINDNPHIAKTKLDEELFLFSSIADMENEFHSASPSGLCWSSNGKYLYMTIRGNGLYKIGSNNSSREILIPFCNSKRYESISASSNGKYLIGERVDSYLELNEQSDPTGLIIESSSIYLINLESLEETKINLE